MAEAMLKGAEPPSDKCDNPFPWIGSTPKEEDWEHFPQTLISAIEALGCAQSILSGRSEDEVTRRFYTIDLRIEEFQGQVEAEATRRGEPLPMFTTEEALELIPRFLHDDWVLAEDLAIVGLRHFNRALDIYHQCGDLSDVANSFLRGCSCLFPTEPWRTAVPPSSARHEAAA
jgi:hypothetical protein